MRRTQRQMELTNLSGSDPVLQEMIKHQMPLDRQTYVAMNWGPKPPSPWTAEHELEIPEPLRRT